MGRHPTHGAPSFRFHPAEVAQMESILREHAGQVPAREFLMSLAEKFSNSPERSGKISVQMKQVWNWFQNRRYALRSKLVKSPGKSHMPPNPQGEVATLRNISPVPQQAPIPTGHNMVRNSSENPLMEFEAKSARDGAWYDVQQFLSHRYLETGNPEVLVRFAGFGQEEDEWVNIRKHVRQRSLPCEASECIVVLPGDLILCFQEGKDQALYFDAHVLDAQRRRHDVRGCRCRFLVRYDHDQSEEIVPLRKVCRRPETDYRLQQLHTANESASASVSGDSIKPTVDPVFSTMSGMTSPNPSAAIAFPSSTTINATTSVLHSASAGISNPSSTLISASAPSLTPKSAPTSSSSLNPVLAATPSSSSIPVSAPSPSFTPICATTLSSTPVSAPNPSLTSSASPTPSLLPISQPTSTAIQAQSSGSALVSAPSPSPSPSPSSTFIAAANPTPAPVSVQSSTLVAAPELVKTESDKPATSAGEASSQENINPGTASIIAEVKKEDSSIPETTNTIAAGSSMSLGEMSDNATETVPAPEKMGSIAPSEPMTTVSGAVTESAPIVSTVAESSNPIASTDDSKE